MIVVYSNLTIRSISKAMCIILYEFSVSTLYLIVLRVDAIVLAFCKADISVQVVDEKRSRHFITSSLVKRRANTSPRGP